MSLFRRRYNKIMEIDEYYKNDSFWFSLNSKKKSEFFLNSYFIFLPNPPKSF